MFKKYRIIKWIGVSFLGLFIILISFGIWFKSLLPPRDPNIETAQVKDLPYVSENVVPYRGKIIAVVTSTDFMGKGQEKTGYEFTELSRAYYTFLANGFEVDVASPEGGKPPVVIDKEDMVDYDYAFLNDSVAQSKVNNTLKISDVNPREYQAIYFVGGKGAMFDFPNNGTLQSIVKEYYQSNKVIGAVCHGPSALVNVVLDNGRPLLENKQVSGFTNDEELLLIPEAASIFPFLLQDKMEEQGARFNEGPMYLETISYDHNLITGQNPWSTWKVAESMVKQLGYTPKYRELTDEENAVSVLVTYNEEGKKKAKNRVETLLIAEKKPVSRVLIAKHAIVAAMKGDIGDFFNLIGLVSFANNCDEKAGEI